MIPIGRIMNNNRLATFVKYHRQRLGMTQSDIAEKSGVGLRFIRELEYGKPSLRLDKVNEVLQLFGHTAGPATSKLLDAYDILLNFAGKQVRIRLRGGKEIVGFLKDPLFEYDEVIAWYIQSNEVGLQEIPHTQIEQINLV